MWHPPFLSERSTIKQVELLCSLLLFISIIGWESRKQRFIYMVCTSLIPSRPSGRKPSMIICGSLWQPKKTQAVWTWEYLTVTIWVCRVSLQFSWNLFNPVWWWLKAWCQLLGFFSVWLKKFFQKREQNFLAGAEKRLYLSELIRKQAAPEKTVPLTWWQREIGCSLNVDCHNACISWKQENRASKEKAGWRGGCWSSAWPEFKVWDV